MKKRYYFTKSSVVRLADLEQGIRTDVSFEEFKVNSKVVEMTEKDSLDREEAIKGYVEADRAVNKARRDWTMLKAMQRPFEEAKKAYEDLKKQFTERWVKNPWIEDRTMVFDLNLNEKFATADEALRALYDCELTAARKLACQLA